MATAAALNSIPGLPLRGGAAATLLNQIGNTPLIRLDRIDAEFPDIEIYGKAEFANPGGSVKDRPALSMILDGELTGRLTPGRTIIDATSGNTGIAYAMIGAYKGYKVKLCLPANASPERKSMMRAYGAEMVFTDPDLGFDAAIRKCREIYEANPDVYFYPDQYNNPANWRAHFEGTAVEILDQTAGRVTHFVAHMGTSGTFTGTARRLRRDAPQVRCISAQPETPFHGIEGTKYYPASLVPGIYDASLADENLWTDTDHAYSMTRRLAREQGLLVGVSAGANVHAATQVARRLAAKAQSAVIVTILCDGAAKYLSEHFWND